MLHPATLAIIVGGSTLRDRAVVVRQRALLPVRALSQALGSRVDYLPSLREIDVRRPGGATIRLRIGSRSAWIGSKSAALDVAPRIIAGRSYAPLRFVADALNVRLHYSAARHAVFVSGKASKASALAPGISGLVPVPYSANATAFPVVGANIDAPKVSASAIRLILDGTDVTMQAKRTARGILYLPSAPLPKGNHVAEVSLDNGATIAERWAFTTTVSAAMPTPEPAQPPLPSQQSFPEIQFYSLDGTTFSAGDSAEVEMVAPQGGYAYAQVCYNGWSYPLYPNATDPQIYDGWVSLPYGSDTQFCPIQGYYVDARGVRYQSPFSIFVTIYGSNYYGHRHDHGQPSPTPSPSPSPSPSPTSAPPVGRRTPPPGNCPPGLRCILGGTPAPLRPPFDGGVKRPGPIAHPIPTTHPAPTTHPVIVPPHHDGGVKRPGPIAHPIPVGHPIPVARPAPTTHPVIAVPHHNGGVNRPVHVTHTVHVTHAAHASHASSTSHSSGSSHTTHHASPHPHPKATAAPQRT